MAWPADHLRDEIHQVIWPGVFVTDDSIAQVVREVRVALNDAAARMLRTVPRRGYLFAVEVREEAQAVAAANGAAANEAPALPDRAPHPPARPIARNSAFVYRGGAVDVRDVGRELGVRYVLEGSVRKAADRVRVTAQLIDAANGAHIWAERYDRGLDDIFAMHNGHRDYSVAATFCVVRSVEYAQMHRRVRLPRIDAGRVWRRILSLPARLP